MSLYSASIRAKSIYECWEILACLPGWYIISQSVQGERVFIVSNRSNTLNTRFFAVMIAVFVLSSVASAQGYSIRVTFNTNLRAAASLQANIIETAASGTTLNVVSELNR